MTFSSFESEEEGLLAYSVYREAAGVDMAASEAAVSAGFRRIAATLDQDGLQRLIHETLSKVADASERVKTFVEAGINYQIWKNRHDLAPPFVTFGS